jgi:hypothetical protein
MKTYLLLIFLLFFNNIFGQIKIEDVGDGWKQKVENSIQLIKEKDKVKYDTLVKYCNHITFWNGNFSTTEDSTSIMISQKDMNSNSLTNIAAVIIHESYHLKKYKFKMNIDLEEYEAYKYEYSFLEKLSTQEYWLKIHCLNMMNFYLKKYNTKK